MSKTDKELEVVLYGNSEFAKNIYSVLAKTSDNVLLSPISIHTTLALVSQGARGKTKETFAKVLNIPDVTAAADGYKVALQLLNSVKDVTLLMANKIFLREGLKLQEAFKNTANVHFYSEVQLLNFSMSDEAANSINDWVEKKTNQKIKNLVDASTFNKDTCLVLVNAIYFKGNWAKPFDPERTTIEKFYLDDNHTIDVEMMHATKPFKVGYNSDIHANILELPYTNDNLSLIAILPHEGHNIAELEENLKEIDLTKITEDLEEEPEVSVAFPKFKIEQTIDLQDSLTELGLGEIFSPDTDLSGTVEKSPELFVSKVIQKVFFEVNEEGTEAGAATDLYEVFMSHPEFYAVRPFLIILQATLEDRIHVLFVGRVSKPNCCRTGLLGRIFKYFRGQKNIWR